MKKKSTPAVGAGRSPYGILLLFLAASFFFGLAGWVLSSKFHATEGSSSGRSREIDATAERTRKALDEFKKSVQIEIQPFSVFCKKALARAPGERTSLPSIDLPEMVQSIYDKKFPALESAFADCQKAYEERRITDAEMDPAHQVFANSDPRMDPLLTEWIGLYPDTPFSWLARARHRRSLAQNARGTKWAKDTSELNFKRMKYLLSMAQQDYVKAQDINPRNPFVYTGMIYSAGYTSEEIFAQAMLSRGLKENPDSVLLWHAALYQAQPKWGGSLEKMDEVLSAALHRVKDPDDVRELKALYYEYKGTYASQNEKDKTAADVFYKQMFENMSLAEQYRYSGENSQTWEDVISNLRKSLALKPFSGKVLKGLSGALLQTRQYEKALVYADVALFLDSLNPDVLRFRGEILEAEKKFDLAIEDYKNSLTYDRDTALAYMHLGHLLDVQGKSVEAASYLTEGLLLDPQNPAMLYVLALNEYERKDCNLLKTTAAYQSACKKTGICAGYAVSWARKASGEMSRSKACR